MQSVFVLTAAVLAASRPITQGQLDASDDGVVGLVAGGRVTCTGTLVAPRVVITAAHCVVSSTVSAVLVGPDLATGRLVAVLHARVHPSFDAASLRDDVALLLLGEPLAAAPWGILPTPLDASVAGSELRLVGFGQTSAADGSAARKRTGTATLASFTDEELELRAAPSLTCGGDSGGPAFLAVDGTTYLAGITSAGDSECRQFTRSVRADRKRSFVAGFVATTDRGAAVLGARCYYPEQCATERCRFPDDAPSVGYCSAACGGDGDCTNGMRCLGGECRYPEPSPGALGAACSSYSECDSLLCPREAAGAAGVCSVVCEESCPAGYACLPAAEQVALAACFREPDDAGCGVAASGPRPPGAWLLLLLVRLRRRFRAASAPCAAAENRTGSCG